MYWRWVSNHILHMGWCLRWLITRRKLHQLLASYIFQFSLHNIDDICMVVIVHIPNFFVYMEIQSKYFKELIISIVIVNDLIENDLFRVFIVADASTTTVITVICMIISDSIDWRVRRDIMVIGFVLLRYMLGSSFDVLNFALNWRIRIAIYIFYSEIIHLWLKFRLTQAISLPDLFKDAYWTLLTAWVIHQLQTPMVFILLPFFCWTALVFCIRFFATRLIRKSRRPSKLRFIWLLTQKLSWWSRQRSITFIK